MNGSGGWPLTVILTPEQAPLWAGTYLPKAQLLSLLEQVSRLWSGDRERLLAGGGVAVAKAGGDRKDGHIGVFTHGWHYILVIYKRTDGKYKT